MPLIEAPGPSSPVIVTGAGSGIGRATAIALAEWGRPVSLWGRDIGRLESAASECRAHGVDAHVLSIDLREVEAIEPGVAAAVAALGGVGGAVHSAGATRPTGMSKFLTGEWDEIMEVNLRAFAVLVKALLPELRSHAPDASVVAVASMAAIQGAVGFPAYSAAKSGVTGLIRSFAASLGPAGIRFNAVLPGMVDTPMTAGVFADPETVARVAKTIPLGRTSTPEDLAGPIRFLLSDQASYVTGLSLPIDGGTREGGRRTG